MDEHEVPTHVQAEDRVLLWFTFPQIVALTAVAALAYGVYQVAPFGPEAVRIGLGLVFALVGIALIVGRVGGRRLPAVAADLTRFGFGPRRFQGPATQLVRTKPPAPPVKRSTAQPQGDEQGIDDQPSNRTTDMQAGTAIQLVASVARRFRGRVRKLANRKRSPRPRTRGERMPFKPPNWFRKRDRKQQPKREFEQSRAALARPRAEPEAQEREHRAAWWPRLLGGAAAVAVVASVVVCCPPLASADDGEEETWTSDEIEFDPPPLIPGRRLFIERLTVTASAATVVLKAAANLEVEVRAFGGADGREPTFHRENRLGTGGRLSYLLPLDGPIPSFTFAWRDEHGQAGAISLAGDQLPYPLPQASGELCDLRLVSLAWRPDRIEGGVRSDCVRTLEERVELQTAAGHRALSQTALLEARVALVSGTLTLSAGGRETTAVFVPGGETRFRLVQPAASGILAVEITTELSADLRIALPPLVQLTHHPRRVERRTETVTLTRPGTSQTVSETIIVADADGKPIPWTISTTLSIPAAQVQKQVTLEIIHDEHVRAELVQRPAMSRTRSESLLLVSAIASDDAYRALVVEREPERPVSIQTRLSQAELDELFQILGWGP
ncbi:MAG: hypothetical protein F4Y35_08495 [Chloroflexi bacterium]|nr:hypothetical protein [Chloroflexota bacterium]